MARDLDPRQQKHLPFRNQPIMVFSSLAPARTTEVYDAYWRFATERQRVFRLRAQGAPPPWTDDPILNQYKFTNAYRAADRVSQYLIRRVIYKGDQSPAEIVFRILLFKLFNKIATWETLQRAFGEIRYDTFVPKRYERVLDKELAERRSIYSAAYIMSSGRALYGYSRKHHTHMRLLSEIMADGLPDKLRRASNLREVFLTLRAYPLLGDFLAYQFAIDLNYSTVIDFSEMEFVVPGPGALDGLSKCFSDSGGLSPADLIRLVTERQQVEFEERGLQFPDLWGRPLQLVDCQNLFCEISKYSRVSHPQFAGIAGRTRIKQHFKSSGPLPKPLFPPKWGLNDRIG
ncbi:MAG: hypothetical protein ICCCNLDF_03586 [Planctomycetes bacterium]|nr:hypothetical protein [Planctomycetota bacterium]